jgi:cytochrome b subunit of formate dehydrogenase
MSAPPREARGRYLVRFDRFDRFLHVLMMVAFLGLAFTGLPLLFAEQPWASRLAHAVGGFRAAAILHRISAAAMILCFALHLARVVRRLVRGDWGVLWGPNSLVPRPKDFSDFFGHLRWFFGRGPRPKFDRFTYWEKFDYWAVFWGMAIIGGSGLVLWFPRLFTRLLPGWLFNVALLVHGEEALLAVGFIFTIHFFNGHLRPEKFPMDPVIFTGVVPEEEVRAERPAEYERLISTGQIERLSAPAPSPRQRRRAFIVGGITVLLGLVLVGFTIYAALT